MANYAVTDYVLRNKNVEELAAAAETYLETLADTQTIYIFDMYREGSGHSLVIIHAD